jgi:hypothetical protein
MCARLILEVGSDGFKVKDVVKCNDSSRVKRTASRDADLIRYAMVDLFRRKDEMRRMRKSKGRKMWPDGFFTKENEYRLTCLKPLELSSSQN